MSLRKEKSTDFFSYSLILRTSKSAYEPFNVNMEFGDEEGQISIDEIARKARI